MGAFTLPFWINNQAITRDGIPMIKDGSSKGSFWKWFCRLEIGLEKRFFKIQKEVTENL
jgi:hypothetical protein